MPQPVREGAIDASPQAGHPQEKPGPSKHLGVQNRSFFRAKRRGEWQSHRSARVEGWRSSGIGPNQIAAAAVPVNETIDGRRTRLVVSSTRPERLMFELRAFRIAETLGSAGSAGEPAEGMRGGRSPAALGFQGESSILWLGIRKGSET